MKEITSEELRKFASRTLEIIGKYYQRQANADETHLAAEGYLKQFCIDNDIKYFEPKERFRNN